MSEWLWTVAWALLVSLAIGLLRISRGPTRADRLLSAQLFGTTGVALLLLLAHILDNRVLNDIALVFALLAAMVVVACVRQGWYPTDNEGEKTYER